ncbi:uncharacterized protein LOC126664246 [Mercurialis annua]|uniref:uncharacterized protein LOC126664246 n=1 Tax=Mercurialis annua TaxID=3986 RepID=UPI00215F0403|nr:uncharacterized protein LOC126664246 [Mercurialis annua]
MSVATEVQSSTKHVPEQRAVSGNKVKAMEIKVEVFKKPQQQRKPNKPAAALSEMPQAAVEQNLSVESSCSSDSNYSSSSSTWSSTKLASSRRILKPKRNGVSSFKVELTQQDMPVKRCDWITSNSDPLYMSFHDEEWGVPVHDDRKLFELLVCSQALAEMSWPAILHMRDVFRKLFNNFDPSSVAQFTEKRLLSLKVNGILLLSEPKLRAIVENAKLLLKVQQEFGSFSNYIWRFMNHKPLKNGFRYARQVPVKTPKSELISKDLMQRGFRCVGPTVVYSFMQVAGIANDHLVKCFRYQDCNANVKKNNDPKVEAAARVAKALESTCLLSQ